MDWKIIGTKDLVPRYSGALWYLDGKHRSIGKPLMKKYISLISAVKFKGLLYLHQYS